MRSSRVSLRPATTHRSVTGVPDSTSAWRTCQPMAAATVSGSGAGRRGTRWPAAGEQVEEAELGQHPVLPVGSRAHHSGEAADAVGERPRLGVDQPGRQVVPRGVPGERRVGEAGAHAVVDPAVELAQPGEGACDPLVAGRRPLLGAGRRRRLDGRLPTGPDPGAVAAGASPARTGAVSAGAAAAGDPPPPGAPGSRPGPPVRRSRRRDQSATGCGALAAGTCPRAQSTSRATACLQGSALLGQEQRDATSTWSTTTSYGSAPPPR